MDVCWVQPAEQGEGSSARGAAAEQPARCGARSRARGSELGSDRQVRSVEQADGRPTCGAEERQSRSESECGWRASAERRRLLSADDRRGQQIAQGQAVFCLQRLRLLLSRLSPCAPLMARSTMRSRRVFARVYESLRRSAARCFGSCCGRTRSSAKQMDEVSEERAGRRWRAKATVCTMLA